MRVFKIVILLLFCLALMHVGYSQDAHLSSEKGETSLGLGLGLPYGGIGIRLGTNVADELNLFGGVGYQISGVGFNIGIRKDLFTFGMSQLYITGMFGTNAAIKISGLSEYDNLYMGPSFGAGVKINSRKKEGNYWDVGLLVPLKSSKYKDDETAVQHDPRISTFTAAWPVLFFVGYNLNL